MDKETKASKRKVTCQGHPVTLELGLGWNPTCLWTPADHHLHTWALQLVSQVLPITSLPSENSPVAPYRSTVHSIPITVWAIWPKYRCKPVVAIEWQELMVCDWYLETQSPSFLHILSGTTFRAYIGGSGYATGGMNSRSDHLLTDEHCPPPRTEALLLCF